MTPIEYIWDDGCWRPSTPYWQKQAQHQFGQGEIRFLDVVEQRSGASHRQFFAWINDVFENLPETYQGRWTTPDDLRKWILTFTKFATREEFSCPSRSEAVRWARNLGSKYDRLEIEGNTVVGYTAQSQSQRSMTKRAFQESKDAVASVCARLLGIDVETLQREAGKAA